LSKFADNKTLNVKTVGIIGGLDFIGCEITLKLLSENYLVKVLEPPGQKKKKSIISTGLKVGDYLQLHTVDFKNTAQLTHLIKDCDFLIHCGMPVKLELKLEKEPVYVPVISDTQYLLQAIGKAPRLGKVIFLSAAVGLNDSYQGSFSGSVQQNKVNSFSTTNNLKKAYYHSNMIINNVLTDFSLNLFQIFFVSPVTVVHNTMTNNRNAVAAGLKYLFNNKINNDRTFNLLIKKNLVETMLNVNEIPDKIFECVKNISEADKQSVLL
jgi:dihydroflavonol-4-reductase